jgi:hypothetical protein
MAQYSGDLTSTGVVAANYRRAIAPFSNFGTRQIAFLAIENLTVNTTTTDARVLTADTSNVGGTGDQYAIYDIGGDDVVVPASYIYSSNSQIYKALNGVALAAEICFVGGVAFAGSGATTAKVVVGVYIDTAASANADMQAAVTANTNAQSIQSAVRAATGDSGLTVKAVFPNGITFTPATTY